ncbi:hypothetical protein AAG906_012105 [Vitis piasezkii]
MVKGWLINSMDHSLVMNFIRYPTAKQVYELRRRVSQMKQVGGSIEKYYNNLQGLWLEIDFLRLNPMSCAIDIQNYHSLLQEERAYAHIRREDLRQSVMVSGAEAVASGVVTAIKGVKSGHSQTLLKSGSSSRSKGHSDGNKCTQTCFKLHGYPDWWHKLQARKK